MTEHKDTSFTSINIKAETLNRLTLFQRSRRGLTALKTIYLTLRLAITFLSDICKVGEHS
jgi:hypothetical protein